MKTPMLLLFLPVLVQASSSVAVKECRDTIAHFTGEIRILGSPNQIYFSSEASAGRLPIVPAKIVLSSKSAKKEENQRQKIDEKTWVAIFGAVPSKEQIMVMRFKQNMENVVGVRMRSLIFFLHKQTLEDAAIPMIKASRFNMVTSSSISMSGEKIELFIVDNLIFNGSPTSEMLEMLKDSIERNSAADYHYANRKRPSLFAEFSDVERMLLDRTPERTESLSAIKYFTFYTLDDESYSHLHWSIHSEEIPGRIRISWK